MGIEGSENDGETPSKPASFSEGEGSPAPLARFPQGYERASGLFDPDAALKEAIHQAIDAGLYERARALLDLLTKTAPVVALHGRRRL